jgi:hypothetical protein
MNNEIQQTAVEWYIDELEKYEKGTSEYFSIPAIQNHARRMEKKQIAKAHGIQFDYSYSQIDPKKITGEQYYNETYGGNK